MADSANTPEENKGITSLNGNIYFDVMSWLHNYLDPKTYFEIGTNKGHSLNLAKCRSIAVDPSFAGPTEPAGKRPVTMYFQMKSDDFFKEYNPKALLNAEVDLAFLDGLHEAETLLRDFYNTEMYCKKNSIICIHDCVPTNTSMLTRAHNGSFWTGDVWKVLSILKEYRSDLNIYVFDAPPTGLVVCTNLDPQSKLLEENYWDIWRKWSRIDLESYGYDRFIEQCEIISTSKLRTAEEMRRFFWL
ncbi:class I SAM-dependent methyltransferase [Labrys sp. La1]|uniref:class I SAM-dependent methyltransferase n=1 Tax=Labrys sp. La1 TaxID=3404917 RepID=UPI003EB7FA14